MRTSQSPSLWPTVRQAQNGWFPMDDHREDKMATKKPAESEVSPSETGRGLLPSPLGPADDFFNKARLQGLDGQTTHLKHKRYIEKMSWAERIFLNRCYNLADPEMDQCDNRGPQAQRSSRIGATFFARQIHQSTQSCGIEVFGTIRLPSVRSWNGAVCRMPSWPLPSLTWPAGFGPQLGRAPADPGEWDAHPE